MGHVAGMTMVCRDIPDGQVLFCSKNLKSSDIRKRDMDTPHFLQYCLDYHNGTTGYLSYFPVMMLILYPESALL